MATPFVHIAQVRQIASKATILDVGDLDISGGTTAVLGPNGSGKSTLLRLLATVDAPAEGVIHINGVATEDATGRAAVRRRLGYVPQHNGLPPRMRVHEYLDYVGALKEIGPERLRRRWIAWALDHVDLASHRHSRIRTLSGGMQRRLTFAQALLGGPDYLVLDEPLTSLDVEYRNQITSLIADLGRRATIVVATHHADELAAVCHRVIVLDAGRIVYDGSPAELADRAIGHVWDAAQPDPHATCRAIGPERHRCVGAARPADARAAQPTVADGYVAVVRYGA